MSPKIIVIAHNLRSCHNVGSLFRTCEGIKVENIYLTGYTPYPSSKTDQRLPHVTNRVEKQIDKTALGAQHTQRWKRLEMIEDAFTEVSSAGFTICALEQSEKSIVINKFKKPEKIALVVGNEVKGLDEAVLKSADAILEIPMYGNKESYNVIQSLAMALYSFRFT